MRSLTTARLHCATHRLRTGPAPGSANVAVKEEDGLRALGAKSGRRPHPGELAEACAAAGKYEFLLTAKPLSLTGGAGSPASAGR